MRLLSPGLVRIVVAGLVLALPAPFGSAAQGGPDPQLAGSLAAQAAGPPLESHHVTLITGDTVRLDVLADGMERASLALGAGASSGYHAFHRGDDAYLVPSVAEPMLAAGVLDIGLFNISDLVDQGLDDQDSAVLPLIVSYEDAQLPGHGMAAVEPPGASSRVAVLQSVDALAVELAKSDSAVFWQEIAPERAGASARTMLSRGIEKIWLDAQVRSTLDTSAGQIGAPAAWENGLTGEGSTIAVLDTGIDAAHPDFAGRVGATADFTGVGSIDDGAGHGTHVASITAGSGAGSEGHYRGIAPGATLLVGKVLDDDGVGTMSAAIDGMEWAASNDAHVVNMSFGGPITAGDDPMSEAVDRLTAEHDILFVASAGNYSPWNPGMGFVTAPAAADSALAVGALHRADSLWSGSRRGRMGGEAIKPEIVAPGFGITAAGASGAGLPPYVSQTGTSMAAPHVAGAAALLKQRHPEWGAAKLRTALTSTAAALDPYLTTYEQGAGRVDIARAASQQVFVDTGVLHLGYFSRPFEQGELEVTRTLTYRNESASPVTLDLTTSMTSGGDEVTPGALTVTPSTLELDAGQSGQASVTLDATELAAGTYSGHITASSDSLRVRTTVGFYKQDDTVDVTLRAVDRNGDPGTATIRIKPYREHDGRYYPEYIYLTPAQPEHTVRLPEGDYNLWSLITTFDESGRYTEHESIVGDPALEVRAPNFEVTLDARDAVPVSLHTPRPSEPRSMSMSWWRGEPGTTLFTEETWYWSFNDGEPENVSVTPTERVDDAPFGLATTFDAGVPVLEASAEGRQLDAVQVAGRLVDGRHRLPVVDVGTGTPDEIGGQDLNGKIALIQESAQLAHSDQVAAAAAAGAEMVALYSAQPGVFWPNRVGGAIPVLALPLAQGVTIKARAAERPVALDLIGTPRTPYAYDVTFAEAGQVPSRLDYRVRPRDLAELETSIYTTGSNERGWRLHQSLFSGCDCGSPAVDDFIPSTGYVRTEYVTARPDVDSISAWQFLFGFPADILYSRAVRIYEQGEKVTEEWLKAPLSPGVPQSEIRAGGRDPVSRRNGDRIHYSLAAVTDSAGHWAPSFSPTSAASRLYLNGKEIYANQRSLSGSARVPGEPATYRLEADVDHDGSLIGLSTRTRTAWTFRSAETGSEEVLPLIDVDYVDLVDADSGRGVLNLANSALAEQQVRLELRASHQDGSQAPPVEEMTVRVSYDDGATWQDADVTADGESFAATYRHPAAESDGYVSLQIVARDGAGSALEQELIRAYRLRAS